MLELVALLVGASLVIATQRIAGPRADRYLSTDERWRKDLLDLGDLLTLDIPVLRDAAYRAWADWDSPHHGIDERALRDAAVEPVEALRDALTRVEWLTIWVSAREGAGRRADLVGIRGREYARTRLPSAHHWSAERGPLLRAYWQREKEERALLLDAVISLAGHRN